MKLVPLILIASTLTLAVPSAIALPQPIVQPYAGPTYFGASYASYVPVGGGCEPSTQSCPPIARVYASGTILVDPTPWGGTQWRPVFLGTSGVIHVLSTPVGFTVDPPMPDVDGGPEPPDCVPNCDVEDVVTYERQLYAWVSELP